MSDPKLPRTTPCIALMAFTIYQQAYLWPLLRRRSIASALHTDIAFISPLKKKSYEERHRHFVSLLIGTIQLHWSINRDSQRRPDWQATLFKCRLNVFERGVIHRIKKLIHVLLCRINLPTEDPTVEENAREKERQYANSFLRSQNYYSHDRASALVDYPFLVFSVRPQGSFFKEFVKAEWTSRCSFDWYREMIDKYNMPRSFCCVWHR